MEFVEGALERSAEAPQREASPKTQKAAEPVPEEELAQRRREWESVSFHGSDEVVGQKREILAQLEMCFFWVVACDRANVRRAEYLAWVDSDEAFLLATMEAVEAAKQRAEHKMLEHGTGGAGNFKALIMWLNMYADWNPTSRTLDQMRNAKWLDECSRVLREELQAEAAERVIGRLDDLASRARRLPGGAALRER